MTFSIVQFDSSKHDRSFFDCGVEQLNRYLATQVGQDRRKRMSACFAAIDDNSSRVAGYYTLSSTNIPLTDLPESITKKLARYPTVPAALLGRLAIDKEFKGCGLGGALLYDAFARAIKSDIMAFSMLVDAKDEQAISFYQHHGFIQFENKPDSLFLPLTIAEKFLVK